MQAPKPEKIELYNFHDFIPDLSIWDVVDDMKIEFAFGDDSFTVIGVENLIYRLHQARVSGLEKLEEFAKVNPEALIKVYG